MTRPTLPRIRRGRARGETGPLVERTEPRIAELSGNGLTWIHINEPGPLEAAYLADRYGFHELDIEDVLSKRQRPKIDEYPEYLFIVLHFPIYDKTVQRLNAAELDVFLGQDFLITLANVELLPVTYLFRRCEEDDELRDELFSKAPGYLLYHVLDDLFDYCFPILDKIGHKLDAIEDELEARRSEEIVRDISDAKQEIIAYRKIIKPERATLRSRAHLGPSRQLQGGGRGARGHERVDHLAPPAIPAPASHRRQRHPAPAHADREHLRDEHARPGRGRRRGLLGRGRVDGGARNRAPRRVPLAPLVVIQG